MSGKDCGHDDCDRRKLYRRLFGGLLAFITLILFIILLTWLILRPTKPHFTLQDITLTNFNLSSSSSFISSTFQVTIVSRNPNERIGVYYDKMDVFASYRSQQITIATLLPPTYQGHRDVNVWSPFLSGNAVPVAPYLAVALNQDQVAGTALINVKVFGRLRWKVGTFISGRYHLYVNCPAYITFGNRNTGIIVGPAIKYQLYQNCNVDV